jgi:hypothetical protein
MLLPRKYPRYPVHVPIVFTGDHDGEGIVTNLSLGGCRVEKADVAAVNKAFLTIRLGLPFHDVPLKIDAAVVRWSAGQDFGLEFVRIAAPEQERLTQYIRELPS